MRSTIKISLGLHKLVDEVQVTYSLWNKLVLKRQIQFQYYPTKRKQIKKLVGFYLNTT